jgi:enhancer of polycomb-like protein
MYDMTEDDSVFLKSYNQKRGANPHLSEDDFERIMEVFEDTAYIKTPFASVDQTIVAYDEMIQGLQDLDTSKVMPHAKEIYEYWKSMRQALSNQPLHPALKFETHQETDEMDPYVCFRRREMRQTRKTRARDVQSADKLKRLRKELEEGRQLVLASHARELLKAEMLKTDRAIFEQRAQLKEHKIRLGIKTDDEDLINQKVSNPKCARYHTLLDTNDLQPQKRKAPEVPAIQRPPPPSSQIRLPVRPDGRPAEADLAQLADRLAEKENELRADIEKKVQNHSEWNKNHVDLTRGPLSPVRGPKLDLSFRPAKTQYLMTPPASVSSGAEEPTPMDLDKPENPPSVFHFWGVSQDEESLERPPKYRRRIGRLNRLWIDRRGMASPPRDHGDDDMSDKWKYDQSSDDEDTTMFEVDPYDIRALRFRSSIPLPAWMTNRPVAVPVGMGNRPAILPPGALPPGALPPGALPPGAQHPNQGVRPPSRQQTGG